MQGIALCSCGGWRGKAGIHGASRREGQAGLGHYLQLRLQWDSFFLEETSVLLFRPSCWLKQALPDALGSSLLLKPTNGEWITCPATPRLALLNKWIKRARPSWHLRVSILERGISAFCVRHMVSNFRK